MRIGGVTANRGLASAKQLTLVACILGSSIALLDSTVVNVALPTIQRDLGGGLAAQQWVVNAYLLTLGSLILIGGSLGDLYGERRIFALGVGGFGVASLLCAIAPSIGALIAARALQGMASALLTPSALAVIVATFGESERGRAIGSWTAWGAIATVLGPLAGGELLQISSWRVIFLINLPLVAICVALILAVIPRAKARRETARRIDFLGGFLCALGLGGPVFALIEQPRLGWSSPAVLGPLLAGAVLLVCFVIHESRARDPMLPLTLFRRRNFSAGNIETLSMYAGLSILFFFLTIFLQQIGGYTPLQSGLATLPATVVMFALSRRFGALADRFGPRLFMGAGPLVAACGLLLFQGVGVHVDYLADVLPGILVFSLGLSMTVAPLTAAVLAGVDAGQAGIASAVNNAVARVAGLLGTAAVGAAVAGSFVSGLNSNLGGRPLGPAAQAAVAQAKKLPLGRPDTNGLPSAQAHAIGAAADEASLDSFHLGLGIAALLVAAGGLAGAIGVRNPRRRVRAKECEGGQLVGAALDAAGCHEGDLALSGETVAATGGG
ncbi:MAG TPA: DHA2 family efflux MFS transporter permease subunit [Solirubrobacteraceae bacterium]|nr:DHA2 family efflux MFS transporter permease subunit [Solirubrobacteraceae bacterium]